jgi:hypothetical protein
MACSGTALALYATCLTFLIFLNLSKDYTIMKYFVTQFFYPVKFDGIEIFCVE